MACGTPVVASRAGAIPEVVGEDGECADLVTAGDVEELAAGLARQLRDPGRRDRLGQAGRRRVLRYYSWSSVAAATAERYAEVIRRARGEPGDDGESTGGATGQDVVKGALPC